MYTTRTLRCGHELALYHLVHMHVQELVVLLSCTTAAEPRASALPPGAHARAGARRAALLHHRRRGKYCYTKTCMYTIRTLRCSHELALYHLVHMHVQGLVVLRSCTTAAEPRASALPPGALACAGARRAALLHHRRRGKYCYTKTCMYTIRTLRCSHKLALCHLVHMYVQGLVVLRSCTTAAEVSTVTQRLVCILLELCGVATS
ncbi:unnamed protein product [Parnassius apollo]|uniref:(apollo) hypothetical protein n=1 Tax=Parnassius apollo TaxID=110799 RepID=A0A8S3WDV0_PARAO|nr:unnamed protein product [Parnassius apollo]